MDKLNNDKDLIEIKSEEKELNEKELKEKQKEENKKLEK